MRQPYSGYRRLVCYERCRVDTDSASHEGAVWNISVLGAYVSVDPIPAVGERVRVVLSLPDHGETVEVTAQVAWRNPAQSPCCPGLPYGCGLTFLDLSPEDRARINALVTAPVGESPR